MRHFASESLKETMSKQLEIVEEALDILAVGSTFKQTAAHAIESLEAHEDARNAQLVDYIDQLDDQDCQITNLKEQIASLNGVNAEQASRIDDLNQRLRLKDFDLSINLVNRANAQRIRALENQPTRIISSLSFLVEDNHTCAEETLAKIRDEINRLSSLRGFNGYANKTRLAPIAEIANKYFEDHKN